jgi:hypothetical protein
VGGWTPGHSVSTIAGGTRLSAASINPVPSVTVMPSATLAATMSATATNQPWINLDRVIFLTMVFTCITAFLHDGEYAMAYGRAERRRTRPAS